MSLGFRIFLLIFWLYFIFVCALLLFTKGFLLKRVVIDNTSVCHSDHWLVTNLWNGVPSTIRLQKDLGKDLCSRSIKPKFEKVVFVIIDGLRYDFLLYNESLNESLLLPYQNKMPKLHNILKVQPNNGKLYKFEADPPTTTMQRIKGMTTGSLPTFIDAGSNFDSYQITEDNILDHTIRKNKNISFMGCSTWTELFPKHFNRKIPFSALNVKDLDTIDYGIMKKLVPEVQRSDWSMIIAHFLGVDHCGHRYGTNHPEMSRKLREMDNVISDLVKSIDESTLLLVMGDHGMTLSGDHGGDSDDEVMAGLFAYSKKKIFPASEKPSIDLPQVSQIDLVPTLALLTDIPIPFSNLGSVIPDFFDGESEDYIPNYIHSTEFSSLHNHTLLIGNLFKNVNMAYLSYLNCKQILTYVNEYQKVSGDLPIDRIEAVKDTFEFLEDKFEDLLEALVLKDWNKERNIIDELEESIAEMQQLQDSFQDVLRHVKSICRSIWAKFDITSISMGTTLMVFVGVITFIAPMFMSVQNMLNPGRFSACAYAFGILLCVGAVVLLTLSTSENNWPIVLNFIAVSFSFSLWLLSNGIYTVFSNLRQLYSLWRKISKRSLLILCCSCVQSISLFSNSYIIHEDSVTLFLCQTFLLVSCFYQIVVNFHTYKVTEQQEQKRKCYTSVKTRVIQHLLNHQNIKSYLYTMLAIFCLRCTKYFWFCREMQLKCNISLYSLPLVALVSEFSVGLAHERLFLGVISIIAYFTTTYLYLLKQWSLNGLTSCVFTVKYIGFICGVSILLHWNLQLAQNIQFKDFVDLGYIQQILLPRIVYILFLISLFCLLYNPLCIKIIFQDDMQRLDMTRIDVPQLYTLLKEKLSQKNSKVPIVYGLQNVYSSSIIPMLFIVTVVVYLVLSDGMAVPVSLLIICSCCLVYLHGQHDTKELISYDTLLFPVLLWIHFSSFGFFGSGHQTTIPAIRFQSAYIGFKGSLPEIVPQVCVVILNTFSSQMVCALALPLLLVFRRISQPSSRKEKTENEVDILENYQYSRLNLFRMMIVYMAASMFKVAMSALSASIHRRHLMVWKIFAPRFLFEACTFLISIPFMLLGYGYFLRVDNTLRRTMNSIG